MLRPFKTLTEILETFSVNFFSSNMKYFTNKINGKKK